MEYISKGVGPPVKMYYLRSFFSQFLNKNYFGDIDGQGITMWLNTFAACLKFLNKDGFKN